MERRQAAMNLAVDFVGNFIFKFILSKWWFENFVVGFVWGKGFVTSSRSTLYTIWYFLCTLSSLPIGEWPGVNVSHWNDDDDDESFYWNHLPHPFFGFSKKISVVARVGICPVYGNTHSLLHGSYKKWVCIVQWHYVS